MPQETVVGDWYIINLRLNVSNEQATTTDSLDDTVNYAQVYKIVREEMATPSRLIEHVCGRIARRLLSDFDMIDAVEISMLKQNPPIGADCDGCGVELTLTR